MSISKTEDELIQLLAALDVDDETFESVIIAMNTDERRQQMINMMIDRYDDIGTVSQQDMMKMVIMLTCKKKEKTQEKSENK